jgi:hypothetical protein
MKKPTPEQQATDDALFLGDMLNRVGDMMLAVVSRAGKRKYLSLSAKEKERLYRLARNERCSVSQLLRVAKVRKQQARRHIKRTAKLLSIALEPEEPKADFPRGMFKHDGEPSQSGYV